MHLGIISAMQEEVFTLVTALKNTETIEKGKRIYHTGLFKNHTVTVVYARIGKVAAAATTTQIINDYPIDEIIFTGVAGAIDPSVAVGDVVIATELLQHDMDTSPLFDRFEIPLLGKSYFETNQNASLHKAVADFSKNIEKHVQPKDLRAFDIQQSRVHKGCILSGDQFIASKEKIKSLKALIPQALCVEMEGAAVAQVCYEYTIPFSVVRIISDAANEAAPIDFPKFTAAIASKYAKGILENYCN
jgi:adenosylhomocysteine nucleosidase